MQMHSPALQGTALLSRTFIGRRMTIKKKIQNKKFVITYDATQSTEVITASSQTKLQNLAPIESTLEVEIPNIFHRTMPITTRAIGKDYPLFRSIERHTFQETKTRKPKVDFCKSDGHTRKDEIVSHYSLVKLLFPESSSVEALNILIMDTIFLNSDGSMTYVFTDSKRGLVKTKSKNYIQLFFKRKTEIDCSKFPEQDWKRKSQGDKKNELLAVHNNYTQESSIKNRESCIRVYKPRDQFLKNLDYVALLRYKDDNFMRLKDHEFKSLFLRPVQANQQYKISETLYIQLIPDQCNYEQGTIFNIEFNLEKQQNTQLFKRAIQKHNEETGYSKCPTSHIIKQQIKSISLSAYLLYLIFQVYAYIIFHHHKELNFGIFEFIKVKDNYFLSNSRQVCIIDSHKVRDQYQSQQLFEEFVDVDQDFDLRTQIMGSEVLKEMTNMFDEENNKICVKVHNIINEHIDRVRNEQDVLQSNKIFKSINEKCQKNLHNFFQNDQEYCKFIKKKQQQLDGFSYLTSISNISRKRIKQKRSRIEAAKQKSRIEAAKQKSRIEAAKQKSRIEAAKQKSQMQNDRKIEKSTLESGKDSRIGFELRGWGKIRKQGWLKNQKSCFRKA